LNQDSLYSTHVQEWESIWANAGSTCVWPIDDVDDEALAQAVGLSLS